MLFASILLGNFIISSVFGLLQAAFLYAVLPRRPGHTRQNPLCIAGSNALLWTTALTILTCISTHRWASATAFHELMPKIVASPAKDWKMMVFLNCGAVVIGLGCTAHALYMRRSDETVLECVYIAVGAAGLGVLTLLPFQISIRNLLLVGGHLGDQLRPVVGVD